MERYLDLPGFGTLSTEIPESVRRTMVGSGTSGVRLRRVTGLALGAGSVETDLESGSSKTDWIKVCIILFHRFWSSLVLVMAWHLIGAKPGSFFTCSQYLIWWWFICAPPDQWGFLAHLFHMLNSIAVLWISGRPVTKCDPSRVRAIQHGPRSRPMGDPTIDKREHD